MKNHQKCVMGFALICLVLCMVCTTQQMQLDPAQLRTEIQAANEKFMATFKAGDAAGLAALYTADAKIMPPNSDFVTGAETIQNFWQILIDMGIAAAKLEIVEVEGYGDTAIEASTFKMFDAEGQTIDYGKYIVIWKQVEGEWKLHRDIFNSSAPAG